MLGGELVEKGGEERFGFSFENFVWKREWGEDRRVAKMIEQLCELQQVMRLV